VTSELLETVRQVPVMSGGLKVARSQPEESNRDVVTELLRRRLELALKMVGEDQDH
jgi:hypothetical protein